MDELGNIGRIITYDTEEIKLYAEDMRNVFGDPDRFGLAYLLVFRGKTSFKQNDYAVFEIGNIQQIQGDIGMDLPAKDIESVLKDWVAKGYALARGTGYLATDKLRMALEKDGVTKSSLNRMANALYG